MPEFVSNTPVSQPLKIPGVDPDRDFNGLMWSFKHGFCFNPVDDFIQFTLPQGRM